MLNVNETDQKELMCEAAAYQCSISSSAYLPIEFQTLEEYLELLEGCARRLNGLGERVCFYLAAAVSDFYIPQNKV